LRGGRHCDLGALRWTRHETCAGGGGRRRA
jgi:hypothetical protein